MLHMCTPCVYSATVHIRATRTGCSPDTSDVVCQFSSRKTTTYIRKLRLQSTSDLSQDDKRACFKPSMKYLTKKNSHSVHSLERSHSTSSQVPLAEGLLQNFKAGLLRRDAFAMACGVLSLPQVPLQVLLGTFCAMISFCGIKFYSCKVTCWLLLRKCVCSGGYNPCWTLKNGEVQLQLETAAAHIIACLVPKM